MGVKESMGNAISEIPSPSEMCDSLLESETYQTASHLPFVPDIKHVEDAKDAFTEIEDGNIIKGGALALKTSVTTAMDVMIPSELICDPEGKSIGTRILDGSQLALDVAGCIPAVGNVADVVNAGISLLRGNKTDAALSLACAIPFVGWGAAAVKILNKLPLKGLKKILKWLLDLLKKLGLGKMFVEFLAKNWKKLKELIGKGGAAVKRALAKGVKAFKGLGQKATKGFKKIGKGIVPKRTGARKVDLDSLSLNEYLKYEKLGDEMYDAIRNNTEDIDKIAQNTGWDRAEIEAIKQHLFYNEHDFIDGSKGQFDSDYWQAETWKRLEEGDFDEVDEMLLNHELFELEYMKKHNCSYEEAHEAANELYNWSEEVFED